MFLIYSENLDDLLLFIKKSSGNSDSIFKSLKPHSK